ncbi:MAG TPA: phosphoadenosine phosphosulfate reductase [Pelotomaculum sp.]|nr:phosphoadenosine phosphosulfate reductase [Pelotomaculum sp.]
MFDDLFNEQVQETIERLRQHEPPEGYYLAYSGGKDSDTILTLAKMAGVKFDAHYQLTTVDPPELVKHIKTHPEVQIHHPEKTMWQLIVENTGPPLRQMRYCCRVLKERGGEGRVVLTGIRKAESFKRSKRQMLEKSRQDPTKSYVNPIMDWTDEDVWRFIRTFNVPYCPLYDEGWKRLGCVCCPNGNQKKQAERWPKLADAYRRACIRAFNAKIASGRAYSYPWKDGDEMYEWWISGAGKGPYREGISYCDDDQSIMFE